MKRVFVLVISLFLLVTMVSCGAADGNVKETEPTVEDVATSQPTDTTPADTTEKVEIPTFDYLANDLTPYIVLGDYTTISVEMTVKTLTDEEYEAQVEALLSEYPYIPFITEDRAAQEGDFLCVSYAGYLDGKLVDNTSVDQTDLTISENSGYIPGFVEGFIGHKAGESFDFDVTFPEDYPNEEVAGVTVTFVGSIYGIYNGTEPITPTLELFVEAYTEFESVDEFNTYFRTMLDSELYYEALSGAYDTIWQQVIEKSEIIAYPGEEVDRLYTMYRENYELYAEAYGVDYETFLKDYVNITDADLRANCEAYVKEDLVLYQLIKDFELELTVEEYNAGCQIYADNFGVTVDELLMYYDKETIELSLYYEKVLSALAEKVQLVTK